MAARHRDHGGSRPQVRGQERAQTALWNARGKHPDHGGPAFVGRNDLGRGRGGNGPVGLRSAQAPAGPAAEPDRIGGKMNEGKSGPEIPLWKLERYLIGELAPAEMARIDKLK